MALYRTTQPAVKAETQRALSAPHDKVRTSPVPGPVHLGNHFEHVGIVPSRSGRCLNTTTLRFVTTAIPTTIQRADMALCRTTQPAVNTDTHKSPSGPQQGYVHSRYQPESIWANVFNTR